MIVYLLLHTLFRATRPKTRLETLRCEEIIVYFSYLLASSHLLKDLNLNINLETKFTPSPTPNISN
jgi:hypothetical protein